MSTRSRIAVELEDGKVLSVYCHWDGYPEGVGSDLINMFPNGSDTSDVIEYIKEGDRSTVDMSYKEKRDEDSPNDIVDSANTFFKGDIEEYGYLYTSDEEWIVKSAGNINEAESLLEVLEDIED